LKTLSVNAIKDYQVCELFYKYRYEDKEPEPLFGREILTLRFENTLKKVASFFFYKKQAGVVPSYNAILNRWEKLWFPKDMTAYDLAVEQHEVAHGNMASYSNVAAAALEEFHDTFAEDESQPILIDEKFLIPIGKDLRLEGSIDLALRKGDNYKVIKWSAKPKRPGMNALVLDFAALRTAFDHRNDTAKKVSYHLYDLSSGISGFIDTEQPSITDKRALLYWANDIKNNDVFVPRRGFTAYCRGCPFDEQCAAFAGWPKI